MSNSMKLKELFNSSKSDGKNALCDLNVTVISNITLELYFQAFMKIAFTDDCIRPYVNIIHFEQYFTEENLTKIIQSDIIIVWLNYEVLCPNIENDILSGEKNESVLKEIEKQCIQLAKYLKKNSSSQIFWFSFEDMYSHTWVFKGNIVPQFDVVNNLNRKLCSYLQDYAVLIDLKKIIAHVGINKAYDYRMKYMWNSPYSKELIQAAVNDIYKQYLIVKGKTKKCIVLDCDNVLWGGIISEDGIENIQLGTIGVGCSFQEFQRFLLTLHHYGIILTICSKNELEDVLAMFRQHSGMLLKEEHIVCFQVNWENKVDNIKNISDILNIGLDSMIYIDDSTFEIELVKAMLPEVTSVLFDRITIYEQLSSLNLSQNINKENIKKRNETYKTNKKRKRLEYNSKTYDDYLAALETKIIIKEAIPTEYNRIAELSLRTNKFTNGKRYTMTDIKKWIEEDEYYLYSVFVSDKYSDFGLVGVIGINKSKIDLLCLSCRVLGRKIEENMFQFIRKRYKIQEVSFVPTGKNDDLKKLLKYFNIKTVDVNF